MKRMYVASGSRCNIFYYGVIIALIIISFESTKLFTLFGLENGE